MRDINVSIIVPVYNVERYLEDCLQSLLNQNIKKEIIIVDDASPDESYKIIKKYEEKYKDVIKVIRLSENKGLSNARNIAIEACSGEYIGFIDSDDFVHDKMFEIMYKEAKREDLDIIICNFKYVDEDAKYEKKNYNNFEIKKVEKRSNEEIVQKFLDGEISASSCDKLYKATIFKDSNIRFPLGRYWEDGPVICKLLTLARSIGIYDEELYYYRNNSGSITRRTYTQKHIDDFIFVTQSIINICKDYSNDIYTKEYEVKYLNFLANMYCKMRLHNKEKIGKLNKIIDVSKFSIREVIRDNKIMRKEKLKYILIKLNIYKYIVGIKYKVGN